VKICVHGIPGFPLGKRNVKDPRLDQADKLVEAQKKVYAQVDAVDEEELVQADAILTSEAGFPDLLLHDLEFLENRLGRSPEQAEKEVLTKLQAALEAGTPAARAGLSPAEREAIAAHRLLTDKPITVAPEAELEDHDALLLRAFHEAGWITYLTVGGKENRAWAITAGETAWEAAAAIHTDIQKGFIRAEIISFADFLEAGGEKEAKRAGKQRLEMKTYVMQDCDVVNFRFNK
jgi:ribosome-binding ATPase YchF (GTP1/OBG family)